MRRWRLFHLTILLLGPIALIGLLFPLIERESQAGGLEQAAPPFLSAPLLGTHTVTSFFDHEYPTYWGGRNHPPGGWCNGTPDNWNDILTRYDGFRVDVNGQPQNICGRDCVNFPNWPGGYTPTGNCADAIYYDGHAG